MVLFIRVVIAAVMIRFFLVSENEGVINKRAKIVFCLVGCTVITGCI